MRRRPDVPSSISPQAQAYLRAHRARRIPLRLTPWLAAVARRGYARADAPAVRERAGRAGVVHHEAVVGGVPVVQLRPPVVVDERPALYVHGGAYFLGAALDPFAVELAARLRRPVVSVEYALAPQAVFPTAVEQCVQVYRALAQDGGPAVLAGVSAGGALALAVLQAVQAEALPAPDRVLLMTPWSDLRPSGDSDTGNEGRDPLIRWRGQLDRAADAYAPAADRTDPRLSPVHATWTAPLPPTLVVTGTRDLFLSSCVRTYWSLRAAGTPVELRVWEGMWHGFFAEADLPETAQCFDEVVRFCEAAAAAPG